MRDFDPFGKKGPKEPLPDVVKVLEPKVGRCSTTIAFWMWVTVRMGGNGWVECIRPLTKTSGYQ